MKRFSLKMCSLIMIVAMLFSFMALPTSAAVIAGTSADFSMSIEKCDDLEDGDGNVAADFGNIYKLIIHMNTNTGLSVFQFGITYDAAKVSLIADDGTGYFSFEDGNSTTEETGMADVANTRLGCLADTGKYGKDGSTQSTTKNILYYGLGLSNAKTTFVVQDVERDSESHLGYLASAGYDPDSQNADYGVMFVRYMCSNAIAKGALMATGDEDVWEIYFKLNDGESLDGAEFRFGTPSASVGTNPNASYSQKIWFGKAITFAGTGATGGSESIAASTAESLESLTTQTLVYEAPAAPSPVRAKGSQIRFNGLEENGAKANFDVRTRAALTAADFAAICGSEDNAKAWAAAGKLQVGFVYTAGTMDVATAKAVATGTAADGYKNVPVTYIQSTGTEYVWTCLIKNADYNASVQALGYIIVDGTAYFFDAASTTTFSSLYDVYYPKYVASLS